MGISAQPTSLIFDIRFGILCSLEVRCAVLEIFFPTPHYALLFSSTLWMIFSHNSANNCSVYSTMLKPNYQFEHCQKLKKCPQKLNLLETSYVLLFCVPTLENILFLTI